MLRSNIGETPKKQPFLRRGVKKNHIGFFDCRIYPISPYEHSPNISSGTPHKATGHGRGEIQNAVQKNKCIRCYPTLVLHYICRISEAVRHSQAENVIFACLCAHLSLYLWNVRVEWHSWKYDFLSPLHFTFTIFELKLEDTSARQNKIKASFVLLCSRLYVSLPLRK